jgi:hypothetical protein
MTARLFGRRGFALLAVLWIIIGLAVLMITLARVTHRALAAAEGHSDRLRGRWIAEGCIARLRASSDAALSEDPYRASARWTMLDSVVGVDTNRTLPGCDISLSIDGRPVVSRATTAQLDSLPGMSDEAITTILRMRASDHPLTSLVPIAAELSPDARAFFDASYSELSRRIVVEPDAWVVRSRAHLGTPPTPVNIEARLVRGGTRAAIAQWVEW